VGAGVVSGAGVVTVVGFVLVVDDMVTRHAAQSSEGSG
jgi:hypothetical protein